MFIPIRFHFWMCLFLLIWCFLLDIPYDRKLIFSFFSLGFIKQDCFASRDFVLIFFWRKTVITSQDVYKPLTLGLFTCTRLGIKMQKIYGFEFFFYTGCRFYCIFFAIFLWRIWNRHFFSDCVNYSLSPFFLAFKFLILDEKNMVIYAVYKKLNYD